MQIEADYSEAIESGRLLKMDLWLKKDAPVAQRTERRLFSVTLNLRGLFQSICPEMTVAHSYFLDRGTYLL